MSHEYFVSLIFDWTVIISTIIIICLFAAYRILTKNHDYFSKRNVPHLKPNLIGNFGPVFFKKISLPDFISHMYKELEGHKVAGIFQFTIPLYLIRDPELIKHVTVKDFEHFTDLMVFTDDIEEPILKKHLQVLKGQKWKDMRSILSPAFTSSKMKIILVLIKEICQQLTTYLETELHKRQTSNQEKSNGDPANILPLDVKDLFTKFTNDVIATSAFGVQCNTFQNPNNDFYKMGKDFLNFSVTRIIILFGYTIMPKFMKLLKIKIVPNKISNFFRSLVRDTIQMREREGIVRPDMIHLLMQVRDDSVIEEKPSNIAESSASQTVDKTKKISLDIDDIAAQALAFFSAGFEVVALLLSFTTVLFAQHQDLQQQVREEIDQVLAQNQHEVTYETIQKMKLLDCFIAETLRMYPPAAALSRKCVKNYQMPDSDLIIEKDISIMIPVQGLHHDPKYFPEPEVFNPDRFSEDYKHSIHPFTYMPFGLGPRQCIANRFALMETKAAIVYLLKHFELHPTSKTKLPIRIAKSLQLSIEGGFWVGFKLRSDTK